MDYSKMNFQQKKNILPVAKLFTEKVHKETGKTFLKFRMVARGDCQEVNLYESKSVAAPTVSSFGLFSVLKISAGNNHHRRFVDVGTAFLCANRDGKAEDVFMEIPPHLTEILVQLKPEFKAFQRKDGSLIVKNLKAVYGERSAPLLWYMEISRTLRQLGYERSDNEPCVFIKDGPNGKHFIVVYVDDSMISSTDLAEVDRVHKVFVEKYKKITVTPELNGKVKFIGLDLDFSIKNQVTVSGPSYVDKLVAEMNITSSVATPMRSEANVSDSDGKELTKRMAKIFRTNVARSLYMATKFRPDILFAVNTLTRRVQNPTVDDWNQLIHLGKYLFGTKDFGVTLSSGVFKIDAYIDASYACHSDSKSHTGLALFMDGACLAAKSVKQKIVTKSSTEAELIGLSDMLNLVTYAADLMKELGIQVETPTVYQDNKSTITLIMSETGANDKTKHLKLKVNWVKQELKNKKVIVKWIPTGDMVADILTKPLQGALFRKHRQKLLNLPEHQLVDKDVDKRVILMLRSMKKQVSKKV